MNTIRKPVRYSVGISSKEPKPPKELPPIGTRVSVRALNDYSLDENGKKRIYRYRHGRVIEHPNQHFALVQMNRGYKECFFAEDMHVVRHERKGGAQ